MKIISKNILEKKILNYSQLINLYIKKLTLIIAVVIVVIIVVVVQTKYQINKSMV